MKLSNKTIDVLKNFSGINQNILIKEGTKLRTMSTMKNILGEADITESFPKGFGIYDLNEFLGVLTLANDPEIEFNNDSYLTIRGGHSKVQYFFSDPSILVTPPEIFNAPETDVSFKVTKESDGRYKIVAPIRFGYTEYNGYKTEHYFNPTNQTNWLFIIC